MGVFDCLRARHCLACATPSRSPPDPALHPHYMQNTQGLWLHYEEWWPRAAHQLPRHEAAPTPPATTPTSLRGVVFLVTGLGEHTTRYDGIAMHLRARGYVVFGLDNQGAGLSEGERLYVERFDDFVCDMLQFMRHILLHTYAHAGLAALPCVVLGHSMGGLIATHVVAALCRRSNTDGVDNDDDDNKSIDKDDDDDDDDGVSADVRATKQRATTTTTTTTTAAAAAAAIADAARGLPRPHALVLSGPAVALTQTPPALLRALARVLACCVPKLPVHRLSVEDISHHTPIVTLARYDPCFGRAHLRARFVAELLAAQQRALDTAAAQLTLPLLIVHGEDDALCAVDGSRALLARIAAATTGADTAQRRAATARLRIYAACGHEVLTERCYGQVWGHVTRFIDAHCGGGGDDDVAGDDDGGGEHGGKGDHASGAATTTTSWREEV